MAEQKIAMPQSTAGLIRYFDESQEAIKLRPQHVVAVSVFIIAIQLILRLVF